MSTAAQRVASAWLRKALSEDEAVELFEEVDLEELPFDHLFEGTRRMVIDPDEFGGLGKSKPDSASSLEEFLYATEMVGSGDTIDWKKGYIYDKDGKIKSKIGKAIGKGLRQSVKSGPLFRAMAKIEQQRGNGLQDNPISRAAKTNNYQSIIGMAAFTDPDFPAQDAWKELEQYGFPSPESWEAIKDAAGKFLKRSVEDRKELKERHEKWYEENKSKIGADERKQYWASRSLYASHTGRDAKDMDRWFQDWLDQTDKTYKGKDGAPIRELFELGKDMKESELRHVRSDVKKLSKIEQQREDYNLWKSAFGEDMVVVLSRDPVDVIRMSDHPKAAQAIESCHSPDGSEWECAREEAREGGLIAYVVRKKDVEGKDLDKDELFEDEDRQIKGIKPYARLRFRRFEKDGGKDGLEVALPETQDRVYGADFSNFAEAMRQWARQEQPDFFAGKWPYSTRASDWTRTGGEYEDTPSEDLFEHFFEREDADENEEEERGDEGPSENEYDPYGEGYTPADSPYLQRDDWGNYEPPSGEAEHGRRWVKPRKDFDYKSDFWNWMNQNHPKIPNPNRSGRKQEISPNTLKSYARSNTGFAQAAYEMVQKYFRQYQQAQKEQRARDAEQKRKQNEAKWLEPKTRQENIDKIKEHGAKPPAFLRGQKDWDTPGVFPQMWQDRLKVDRDGNPLKDYPLKKAANALSDNFWGWSARRVAAAWLQHKVAKESDNFWAWMQQRHPRVPNPNPEGREKDIAPRTLKQYAEGGEFAQRAQQIIRRYQQQFVKARGQQEQRPAHDKYSHVELRIRNKAPGERERIERMLEATTDQEIRQRALDLSGMGYLSDTVNEVTIVSRKKGRVEVTGYGDHGLFFNRELDFNEDGSKKGIFNVVFSVADDAPEGFGTRMIAGQVAAAHQAGFPRIDTHAEGESGTNFNGYYTWPRLGFNTEARPVLEKMPPELLREVEKLAHQDGAESPQMRHIMMLPEGRDWWKKEGSSISVGMPTDPDSPERKILNEYVEERAKRAGSASAQEWLLKRASRQQRFPLSELENEALDAVWDRELKRVRGKKKTAKYNSEFMQWAEQQRFIQPETRNRVKFVSLPEEEQKRIYERWRQMNYGDEAERVRQENRWLFPNQDPRRYDHIKFEIRVEDEVEETQRTLEQTFGTSDQNEIRNQILDLSGLGGIASMVESVDVISWRDESDYEFTIKVVGRGKHGLHFDRSLHYNETVDEEQPFMPSHIENNLFSVGRDAPAGIGTRMLASQVGAAENAGFRTIETDAAGGPGASMNGYYTWPRLGFNAPFSKEDLRELEEDNPEAAWQVQQLAEMDENRMFEESPAEMFHVMAIPEAREWWEKNGHGFVTSFPLSEDFDGGKAYQLLRGYTEAKAMAEGKTIPEYLAKIAGKKPQHMAPRLTKQDQKLLDQVWKQARQRIQANAKKKKASELARFWLRTHILKSSLGI